MRSRPQSVPQLLILDTVMKFSPETLAISTMPKTTVCHQITSNDQWHGLRAKDVTASVAGALLGVHRMSALGLYNLKKGIDVDDVDTEVVQESGDGWWSASYPPATRGHALEPLAMEETRRRTGWDISYPLNRYFRDPERRIGATPDAFAIDPARPGFGIIQFKTVAPDVFETKWRDRETRDVIPPDWVMVQAITEAKITGASWACIVVVRLTHKLEFAGVVIPVHDDIWNRLCGEVAHFWRQFDADQPPEIDWVKDAERVMRMFKDARGPQIDLSGDNELAEILAEHAQFKRIEAAGTAAAKERKILDARIVFKMGDAESAIGPGGASISAKTINRKGYSVEPSSYRQVRVSGVIAPTQSAVPGSNIPERF